MSDIRKESVTRYHTRFVGPYGQTVEISKDIMMACQRAEELFEGGSPFHRKVYVVEVKEKVIRSFER